MWLCCNKICGRLRLGFNTSFFLFHSLEQNLIFFQLLVFLHLIVNNCEISFKCAAKVIEDPNVECVYNYDVLVFDTNLESIVDWAIPSYIFASDIDELINSGDSCPLTCCILKIIPFLKPFSKILSQPVCFYSLQFLLYVAETYSTNITLTFDIIFGPDDYFISAFFLTLEFGLIFKLLSLRIIGTGLEFSLFDNLWSQSLADFRKYCIFRAHFL